MPTSSDWRQPNGATQVCPSDRGAATDYARVHPPPTAVSLSVLVPVYNERHLVETSLRRVLSLQDPVVADLQVVAVNDGSTDGSGDVLDVLQREDRRLIVVHHERNLGKGAAVRTAVGRATGDVCLVHDADLEYNPGDIPALLRPFIEEGADAVFGSRYLAAPSLRSSAISPCSIAKGDAGISSSRRSAQVFSPRPGPWDGSSSSPACSCSERELSPPRMDRPEGWPR